jgi:N-dimethylarginine dimethylaminohydrolase
MKAKLMRKTDAAIKSKAKMIRPLHDLAAYGGEGWTPRTTSLRQEVGSIWGPCGVATEWSTLKAVLLHRPDRELTASQDANAVQMLAPVNLEKARQQHDAIARAYEDAGVLVHYVEPSSEPLPNQMFVADLFFMTPEGAILGRPASTIRAGEERHVACRLAALGVPILCSVRGQGTFEGADALWLDPQTVMLARGLRTNAEGWSQVADFLGKLGVAVIPVDLPFGTMHLMGMLRFADRDLALAWPRRLAYSAVEALRRKGFQVFFLPQAHEAENGFALNFVTLGPRSILMPAGNRATQRFYESLGIDCRTVATDELAKAAGAVGCLTGILQREI